MAQLLRRLQGSRCCEINLCLLRIGKVDHLIALFQASRQLRKLAWPWLLWAQSNLQAINHKVKAAKCVAEARGRRAVRINAEEKLRLARR